jgi:hypothetical protein
MPLIWASGSKAISDIVKIESICEGFFFLFPLIKGGLEGVVFLI